jgi:hypothetical protein
MQENQKDEKKPKKKPETWAEDQSEHEYYYDDAHGYEEYEPDGDDNECEDREDAAG